MALSRSIAIGVAGQLIGAIDRAYTGFSTVVDAAETAARTLQAQLNEFSHFEFNPKFRTRVISIPSAMDGFNELWQTITVDIREKVDQVVSEMDEIVHFLRNLPPRAPGEPLLQRTSLILQFVHVFNDRLASFVTRILDLTSTIANVKQRIETLDDLFLSQASRRVAGDYHYKKRNVRAPNTETL